MPELEVVAIPNGQFVQNCYLVADRRTRHAVIIDPGEEPQVFLNELDSRAWTLSAIWLTHGHLDHIMGVAAIKSATGVPILLHPDDRGLYDDLPNQGAWMGQQLELPPAPDFALIGGQNLKVGGLTFQVRHTPGHSQGSVSFVGHGVVFGGDVLFNGSIGRTDLPGGDFGTLMASIHREFMTLPDSTVVYSGHGPETTIGVERMTNPFLTGAASLE